MNNPMTEDQLAQAMLDPDSIFENPMAVATNKYLSTTQKIELLKRWEYDAREIQVAVEEGFPASESGALLDDVLSALHSLGGHPDIDHTPPTKQGGV